VTAPDPDSGSDSDSELEDITVSVNPSSVVAPGQVTLTATIPLFFPEGRSPPEMTFDLRGAAEQTVKATTLEADGEAGVWRYTATADVAVAGKYTVAATAAGYDPGATTFTATAPPVQVELTQDSEASPVGDALVLTATAKNAGHGTWHVRATGANESTLVETSSRNPLNVQYEGVVAGVDTIVATWVEGERKTSAEVRHTWTERPAAPCLSIEQASASSVIGSELALVIGLSGGSARSGELSLQVDGANPGELELEGEAFPYTARYTGTRPGDDVIKAVWTDGKTTVERTITHTWTAPRIEVVVSTGAADLGETAVVTVRLPDGTAGGSLGLRVLSGPHAGSLDLIERGSGFQAEYVGLAPGTDVIEASLTGAELETAPTATASITWRTPTVALTQATTSSVVGTEHTVAVEVTGTTGGTVAVGIEGANAGAEVDVTRGSDGIYRARYTGSTAGTDRITATVTVGRQAHASSPLTHDWIRPVVTANQDTTQSEPGQPVTLSAVVVPAGLPGAVVFTASGNGPDLTFRDDDPADGWTATYTREAEGNDTITAVFVTEEGTEFTGVPLEHVWRVDPPPTVLLSPSGATSCTGSPFTVTASVTDDATPVADVPVRLSVGPSLPGNAPTGTTGPDGGAQLAYSRDDPGVDTLVAVALLPSGAAVSATVTHVWEDCALAVTVGPESASSTAGSDFTATARVVDGEGTPVAGARVEARASTPGQPDVTAVLTTGPNGLASWTWTRPAAGTDRIDVDVDEGNRSGRATTDHRWTEPTNLGLRLGPPGTSGAVDSPFTATALVTDGGVPMAGAEVRFRAVLPGADDVVQVARTDADGQASATYTREIAGQETIEAEVVVDGQRATATMRHEWVRAVGLDIRLDPAGASTRVGHEFTVTATVTDDGEPSTGAEVVFRSSVDGGPERTGTTTVDATGRATFTYSRDAAGPDRVQATVTAADDRTAEASLSHLWLDDRGPVLPQRPPATLAAEGALVPDGTAMVTGTGCASGALVELFLDDTPVATTRADSSGNHRTELPLTEVQVGRHLLRAECQPVAATAPMDVVVPTASGGAPGPAAATAMAVFGFFVLLGGQVVRLSGGNPAAGVTGS
jgi:hypothetical protein